MNSTANNSVPMFLIATLLLLLGGCATEDPPPQVFARLVEPFVFDSLAMTPIKATQVGYHEHIRGGETEGEEATHIALDEMLDDYTPAAVEQRIRFYKEFGERLHREVSRKRLSETAWVDYEVVENLAARQLFELDRARTYEHNPNLYVELAGRALYAPLVLEYAPKAQRYRHIIARLEKLPAFLDQAKQNLKSSPEVWTSAAREANLGVITLVEQVIPASLPEELSGEYQRVSKPALQALRDFTDYLASDLASRNQYDWRMGSDLYAEKLKLAMAADRSPEDLLAEVESALEKTYQQAIESARPLHRQIYGNQRPPTDLALMAEVFDVVSDENRLRNPADLIDEVKKDVDAARQFTQDEELVLLPPGQNLQVITTPRFLRGVYPVAGLMGAPQLEPSLAAFYFVTPIPSDLPRARMISILREYNKFKLELMTIAEAMPGNYVQVEFGNAVEPLFRRALRGAYPSGLYVEGWKVFITDAMVNAGFHQESKELQFIWMKEKLRIIADAILDIRMHTMNMSEDEAMDLLRKRAFQEPDEARIQIQQVQLTAAKLPLQYAGWQEWLQVQQHYQTETTDFSPSSFHDKALRAGPVPPVPELGYLVSERPMNTGASE